MFKKFFGSIFILFFFFGTLHAADITDLEGITGKVGLEDIQWVDNTGIPTFNVPTYDGGTIALNKVPSVPWYDVRSYTSINAAVTAIGATAGTLVVPNSKILTANLTIPSTLSLFIPKGGSIVKASTYTLTINGPFEAGLYQVFSGFSAGNVTFGPGSVKEVYPQWWGAKANGTDDDTVACNAAHASLPLDMSWGSPHIRMGTVKYSTGRFMITSPIKYSGGEIAGDGSLATIIYNATTDQDSFQANPTVKYSARHISIKNLGIQGSLVATAGAAINLDDTLDGGSSPVIENVEIFGHFNGINLRDVVIGSLNKVIVFFATNDGFTQSGYINGLTMISCYANSCGRYGYNLKPTGSSFTACAADLNQDGWHFYSNNINDVATNVALMGCSGEENTRYNFYAEYPRYISIDAFWGYAPAGVDGMRFDGGVGIILNACYGQGTAGYGLYLGINPYNSYGASVIESGNSWTGGTGGVYNSGAGSATRAVIDGGATYLYGGTSATLLHLQPRASVTTYQIELKALYDAARYFDLLWGSTLKSYFYGGPNILGLGNIDGSIITSFLANKINITTAKTPADAGDTGTVGDICWDANYIYVCVAANSWKRVAIAAW